MLARRWTDRIAEPFRFGLVGIANTITGLTVIWLGLRMGLGDVPANVLGYAAGLAQGFVLNRRWTFHEGAADAGAQLVRYVLAFLPAYGLNMLVVLAFVAAGVVRNPATHVVGIAVYTVAFYLLCARFVFKTPVPASAGDDGPPHDALRGDARSSFTARRVSSLVAGRARALAAPIADHFALLLVLLAVATFLALKDIPLGHDQSWYLISVHKMLAGARPYVDLIELNPPLNFYLVMPAVFMAERLGVPPEHAFVAYVIALACGSTLWARHLLRNARSLSRGQVDGAAILGFLSATALAVFDFGQRDILLVIFTFPYLALSLSRIESAPVGRGHAVAVGLWAALGICLKHFFLVFLLATEIALYLRRRKISGVLRPEVIAVGAAGILYAVAVVALFPVYLETIVPMARATYFAYGIHFPMSLFCVEVLIFPLVFGSYWFLRRHNALGAWLDMLAAWAAAAFVSYVIQNRGFTYHAEPLRIYLVLLALSLIGRKFHARVPLARFCLLAGLGLVAVRVEVLGLYDDDWANRARQVIARYGAPDGLYTFTAHVFIGFPLANRVYGPWVSRFNGLWPVPGAERILAAPERFSPEQVAAAKKADRYVRDAVIEDFERKMPSIVIVDARENKSYFDGLKFDYVASFSRDPRFARMWRNYTLVDRLSGFEIWRKAPADPAVSAR